MSKKIETKKNKPYVVTSSGKAFDVGNRRVVGLANAYNYVDSDGDMLMRGCSAKSIQERGANSKSGNKIKQLWQHDWNKPSARIDVLDEREVMYEGKAYEGIYHESYYPDTAVGNEVYENIVNGVIDGRSIGFQYGIVDYAKRDTDNEEWKRNWEECMKFCQNPEEADKRGEVFLVREIRLFEISDVSMAANPFTFTLSKSATAKDIHKQIRQKQAYLISALQKRTNATPDALKTIEMELRQLFLLWENAVRVEQKPSKIDTFAAEKSPESDTSQPKGAKSFLLHLT